MGNGIEWNQIFSTESVRQAGGWDDRFGPGHRWGAGEAFILMFRLHKLGFRPRSTQAITVSHPAPLDNNEFSALAKFRHYREAQGAILLALRDSMSPWEWVLWLTRFTLPPLPGAIHALVHGRLAVAALRACTPGDVIAGMLKFSRENTGGAAAH